MSWWSDMQDLSRPWRFSLDEWKDKVQNSSVGSPIHGLRAGYEMTKLGSAHRLKQGIDRINDGQNPFSSEFIRGTANDQGNNVADAFKENWPVLAFWGGGALSNASEGLGEAFSGGSAFGGGEGGATGGGLLAGGEGGAVGAGANYGAQLMQKPQPMQQAPAMQPKDPQAEQRARMAMLQQMQLQQLRQKPNKTLEEWQMLQQATKNQGLLGGM